MRCRLPASPVPWRTIRAPRCARQEGDPKRGTRVPSVGEYETLVLVVQVWGLVFSLKFLEKLWRMVLGVPAQAPRSYAPDWMDRRVFVDGCTRKTSQVVDRVRLNGYYRLVEIWLYIVIEEIE